MRVIKARWRLIIVCVLVITGIAVVGTFLRTPTYQGEAQVLLTPQSTGSTLLGPSDTQIAVQPQRYLGTQIKVMGSRPLVEAVIKSEDLQTTPEQLLKRVKFVADGQTDIVRIVVTDSSAERAARTANAFAETYVAWSKDLQGASIKAAADDIEKRLVLLQEQITSIEATGSQGGVGAKQAMLSAAKEQYAALSTKLNQLRTNEGIATGSGSILATAVADPVRVSPSHTIDIGLGLVIALVFGVGMAFVAEALDVTIKSPEEAGRLYGAPVMGNILTEEFKDDDASRLTLVQHPGSPAAEGYRVLRTNLDFINHDIGIKTLLITSAVPDEGKSTVAANLATALARAGKKVALVICDFHRPTSPRFFDVSHEVGLSDVLKGPADGVVPLQQSSGLENLWILTSGALPPNPSELLGSKNMENLIARLRQQMDWVILDSPPMLALADAAVTARWVDGVLVVARVGLTKRDAAHKARAQLDKVGARILGVAVWDRDLGVGTNSYYGYQGYTSK
jgi:capsular exopolysaccharide synthesis family protein